MSDEKVLYELLQEIKDSDISQSKYNSGSKTNVKGSPCDEHSVSFDEEANVSDNISMKSHTGKSMYKATEFSIYWQAWHKY
jgi:hypothetical protein